MRFPFKKSKHFGKGIVRILALLVFSGINMTYAQITQPTAWTKAYDQASGTCTGVSFPVAAGSNRILIVGFSHSFPAASANQANPTTISYGGVTLTLAASNGTGVSGRMHTWLYYLKDNVVMNGTSQPLNVTLAGTHANVTVWYSVYEGVDQTPATYTNGNGLNNTQGSGPAQLSAAMAVNINEQAIYISSIYGASTTVPTYTINANWTTGGNNTGNNGTVSWKNEVTKRAIPVVNTTDVAATSALTPNTTRWAMSAMSLPMAVAVSPTLTLSNPTTSIGAASLCGPATKVPIHAFNIACSGGASTLTNFQFTTTGTYIAADLANYKIWYNSTNALGTATLLATNASPGGPGAKTFTAFSLNIPNTTTYYFWITADISATPVSGHTVTVGSSASADMTTTAIKAGGPTTASGTQTLDATPATPGTITGLTSPAPSTAGVSYVIAAVSGTTTYTWTVPSGWLITAGQGTSGITVTSGAIGQNGNITVTAGNTCGTSAASSKSVSPAVPDPHANSCSSCHINHNAIAGTLTSVIGNANLCISCHNPTGSASAKALANADKAIPGTSGTSHAWDKNAVNATFQTNAPANAAMLLRVNSGQIICSTCHDQHKQTNYPYLRADNTGDALCKDCHSARNLGTYASNPATNRSSHPVGITYNGADPGYLASPTAPIILANSKVECSSCHKTHFAGSTDGNILRKANDVALCTSCHVSMTHNGMTCNTCHQTHNPNKSNIFLIRDNITTPNSGIKNVVFTALTGTGSFAEAAPPYDGVCEVCHTTTIYHKNNGTGASHNASANCTSCHKHGNAFRASCFDCHNTAQGTRRQIVDNTGNGLGTGGDFRRSSHHVTGSIPKESDCILCHDMIAHRGGTVRLKDDLGTIYSYDPANKSSVEGFCLNCHDANGFGGDITPLSDGVAVPVINSAMWTASSHKTAGTTNANTCLACHDNGHGSNKSALLGPYSKIADATADPMDEEEEFCLGCHGGTGVASVKVHLAFSSYTNTATNFNKHAPESTYRLHKAGESGSAAFSGTNRHIECVDCHNPHGAVAGTTTAPALLPTLTGVKGVEPVYGASNTSTGAPTAFIWLTSVTQEYQVCYKCHSSYTTLPTYLPGGLNNAGVVQTDGLKKLTTAGTNTQIADSRDMAQEYNPNHASFHPVMAVGKNTGINVSTFQTGWSATSRVYCSSCHNNSNSATPGQGRGPHGSGNLHILDKGTGATATQGYNTVHGQPAATDFCTKCHMPTAYISNNTGSRYAYHLYHVANKTTETCYTCHDTHGSEQFHLINFSRNQAAGCITSVTTNTQAAFLHALGTAANTCNVTCHGTSHGGGKTYTPAYN